MRACRSVWVAVLVCVVAAEAQGIETVWVGASSSDWSDPANWSPVVPTYEPPCYAHVNASGSFVPEITQLGVECYNLRVGCEFGGSVPVTGQVIMLDGSTFTTDHENIGHTAWYTGKFVQLGGDHTVNDYLNIGGARASTGVFDLRGGSLSVHNEIEISSLSADLIQSGGALSVADLFVTGDDQPGILCNRVTLSGGELTVRRWTFLEGGFTQTGGVATLVNDLVINDMTKHNSPVYDISGGEMHCGDNVLIGSHTHSLVGYHGTMNQSGGEVVIDGFLSLAHAAKPNRGYYNLDGGSLWVKGGWEVVGRHGTATFTQTDGDHIVDGILQVGGYEGGGNGTFTLDGGTLSVRGAYESVGHSGTGVFTQTDGIHTVVGPLYIGYNHKADREGTFTISGGTLDVGSLYVGFNGVGTLNIPTLDPDITVRDTLHIGPLGTLNCVPGTVIHMTGSAFENLSTEPGNVQLENLELVFEGGNVDIDPFEVGGEDFGPVMDGFLTNFALGALVLGGSDIGQVQLVDDFDNQPDWIGDEVLYVLDLTIGPGSSLDLNGMTLYYGQAAIDPDATINHAGGQLVQIGGPDQIPEPATLGLLTLGALALLRRRRRR